MTARRPVDASMSLLTEVMRHPLDPGYAEASARKAMPDYRHPRRARRAFILLVAVGLGTATTVAVVSLRAPEPAVLAARTLLEKQITDRTAQATALRASNQALSDEVAALQAQALAAQDPALIARLKSGDVASGASAVTGPGLRVSLADAPADASGNVPADSMVQDADLQSVVNSLWASGAEAIAINGQRLTSLTAIRSAGSAILVDLVPLSGPYTVDAIGNPDTMQTRFARTPAASELAYLRSTWGISTDVTAKKTLQLPGAGALSLRFASPLVPNAASVPSTAATAASGSGVASSDTEVVALAPTGDSRTDGGGMP
ncbi:hypothetical protein GALL_248820 [mine drainage metagenome]|uniref:DUF881 domain-containing protein n=1 Tax=mine drainage metagenome TaxID=410659 RepID=A0A1J5RAR9_9ZZZZ